MAYQKDKHDIGLLRKGGSTTVGFILAKDKDGNKVYEEYDDEYLALHQSAEAGYESLQPEKEFQIGQESYRSGFGLREYDSRDPERYHVSTNVDHRNRGMALPSYDITEASLPTGAPIPTIVNADFETDVSPESGFGWTIGVGAWARASDQKHGDTYSWKETNVSTGDYLQQEVTGFLRGAAYTFKLWIRTDGTDTFKIVIDDGPTNTDSSTASSEDTWTQFSVTHTMSLNATRFRLRVWCVAQAAQGAVWVDDATITSSYSPTVGVVSHRGVAEFNDKLYAAFGTLLTKLNSGGTAFDIVGILPETITCLEPFTDDKLYISQSTSAKYYQMNAGETLTINDLANASMEQMVTVHSAAPTMWGKDSANTLRSTVNPAAGGTAWSGQTTVDSSFKAITDLKAYTNLLYIMKEDKPYYLNSSSQVKVLTEITEAITHSDGGKNVTIWNGQLYMPWSTEALLEYNDTDSTFTWLNPSKFATESSSFDGQIQALAGDEEWLFAGINNGVLNEIMCGRYEVINGTTSWVWHPYKEITLTGIKVMSISTVSQKRLWIFSDTIGEAPVYIPLPVGYGDIATDANRDFASSGAFETPWQHANFKGDSKAYIKCTLRMGNTTANIYWTAYYKKLGDSNWTKIGDFKTSPSTTQYIPVDSSSNNPSSVSMKFKFEYTTNSTTVAPILYGWDVRGILYPTRRDLIYCEVRCTDDILLNDGSQDRDTGAPEIKATLEEFKNDTTFPALFYDLEGATTKVKLMTTGKPFSKVVKMPSEEGKKKNERRFYLLLQKVPGI